MEETGHPRHRVGEQAEGTRVSTAAQRGQPLLRRPHPSSAGVGGGPPGRVVPFQGRARRGSEEGAACACPTSSSPQRGLKHRRVRLLRTPPGRSPPTAWLLRCC